MWPRIALFISPVDREAGLYSVRLRKGWWSGPGTGGTGVLLLELTLELRATDERERMREALRATADLL